MRPSAAQPLRNSTPARPWRGAALGLLGALLGACYTSPSMPEPEPGAYDGPAITSGALAGEHVLIASLPAPGYEFTLDGTRETFQGQDVYVSLKKPNPAILYAQVAVQLHLGSGVPVRYPARVLARVMNYGEKDGPGYREALAIAADTSGVIPPPPPISTDTTLPQ